VPEGDTIHRTAAALRAALIGRATTAFQAPRLDGILPSPGSVIERVESRGKHLEIGWDDGCVLHTHMRMSGTWHLYRPGEQWRKSSKQMRVVIEVPGWQAVCFSAPVVETYRAGAFTRHPVVGSLGPDLCKVDADVGECVDRMGRYCDAERTAAEALLDQRIACGVGNVYKSEVLWACELHPFTPVGALDNDQRATLIEKASQLLRANLETPTRVTASGSPEGLAVYGRFGKPCLRCSTPIEVRKHGEQARVTYWCPSCQLYLPLPEPDPDEAPLGAEVPTRRFLWRRRERRRPAIAEEVVDEDDAPADERPEWSDERSEWSDEPSERSDERSERPERSDERHRRAAGEPDAEGTPAPERVRAVPVSSRSDGGRLGRRASQTAAQAYLARRRPRPIPLGLDPLVVREY
jgi:endonuclease VIII